MQDLWTLQQEFEIGIFDDFAAELEAECEAVVQEQIQELETHQQGALLEYEQWASEERENID